ncbi:MAG: hypothetical protein JGK31_31525 [Microcoleus sp. PH2017_30_WIL_O_A]|nr:hypothetical protein [Microcoleus sp. PH2017_30_WIL_O_A]
MYTYSGDRDRTTVVELFCALGGKKTFRSGTRRKWVYDLKYNKVFNGNCRRTCRSPTSV